MYSKCIAALVACLFSVSATATSYSQQPVKKVEGVQYSPTAEKNFPMNVYFGDTHLHTSYSPDANLAGNIKLGPRDAYRFAKGKPVFAHNGMIAKLYRPLDFLVVSDHAEYLGLLPKLRSGDPELLKNKHAKRWYDMLNKGAESAHEAGMELINEIGRNEENIKDQRINRSVWAEMVKVADEENEPGKFTAFIGYEWTSMPGGGDNLHRVVLFRDGADKAGQIVPFSSFDGQDPEQLWAFLDGYEKKTGGKVLAIPHNGNVSNGLMFQTVDFHGKPLTKEYAEQRMRWEPLVEVTQIKGDGETHPYLSPDDEFADYETWDKSNLLGNVPKTKDMLPHEYARSALKIGLSLDDQLGANPFQFGMIGSTDAHTSLPTADSSNFWGKISAFEPTAQRYKMPLIVPEDKSKERSTFGYDMAASGYAAVWATENTREALFDAMQRRETYATTGPRMVVRFFGGWDFTKDDAYSPDFAMIGYQKGVPMGGELSKAPESKVPTFLLKALKYADGANLDRIQVVKGWLDDNGKTHEKIYNVALSDDRKVAANGKVKPVGNTVDVKTATYKNTIGDVELVTMWQDPDFNPNQKAFYYARVLQIPTPRWVAYDAARFNEKVPDNIEMITQERAYTSPIWYSPSQ